MTYIEFKILYMNCLKAARYMASQRLKIQDPKDPKWQALLNAFYSKTVEPLEAAWRGLPQNIRMQFMPNPEKLSRGDKDETKF